MRLQVCLDPAGHPFCLWVPDEGVPGAGTGEAVAMTEPTPLA